MYLRQTEKSHLAIRHVTVNGANIPNEAPQPDVQGRNGAYSRKQKVMKRAAMGSHE